MIALFGCCADDNVLVALDVPGVYDDEGTAIGARFRPAPLTTGAVNAYNKLRQIAQAVSLGGPATVRLTPYVDGAPFIDQQQDITLVTLDGLDQRIECHVAIPGTRFAFLLEVLDLSGSLQFGEAALQVVPKRRNTT